MTEKIYLFRHKTIRRFSTAGFEFSNFELRIEGEEERERFIEIVKGLPSRDGLQIVEVNEEARDSVETSIVDNGAVRGAMTASDILTGKDRAAIAAAAGTQGAATGANNLAPAPGAPTGFTGFKNLGK